MPIVHRNCISNLCEYAYIECKIYDKLFSASNITGVAVVIMVNEWFHTISYPFFSCQKILMLPQSGGNKALCRGYSCIERRNRLKNFQPKLFSVVQLQFFRFCIFLPSPNPKHCLLCRWFTSRPFGTKAIVYSHSTVCFGCGLSVHSFIPFRFVSFLHLHCVKKCITRSLFVFKFICHGILRYLFYLFDSH